jgi:hypothetical protein
MICNRLTAAALCLAAALAAAGAAGAQAVGPAPDQTDAAQALRSAILPSTPRIVVASPYAQAQQSRIPGVATTSVDHSFARKGLVGSAGFLCGLHPGQGRDGGAAAYGFDPQGRFLGGKLSLAFN